MVKIKPAKNKKQNLNKKEQKSKSDKSDKPNNPDKSDKPNNPDNSDKSYNSDKSDIISFLQQIKINVDKIKSTKNKKYSLLSCVFLCFLEKKKKIIDKKEIIDFIKKEINQNEKKIFHININTKKVEPDLITQRNYNSKLNQLLLKCKYFTKTINMGSSTDGEQIELNEEYINPRKNSIFKQLFGRKLYYTKNSPKKRKRRKFEKSISIVKTENKKNRKKDNNSNDKKMIDISDKINKNDNQSESDSDTPLSKESKINERKEDLNHFNLIFDKIKLKKKINSLGRNIFLNQKRKNPFNFNFNDNGLIMPLFAGQSNNVNEKNNINYTDNIYNINYEIKKEEEIVSTSKSLSSSINEINTIIEKGEEFIFSLQNQKLIDLFQTYDRFEFLSNYKDNSTILNFLNNAMEEYTKFTKNLEYFMNNKESNFDSEEEFNDIFIKENNKNDISENFKIKKIKCSLLISKIITKLSQFLLEYNFIVETINKIYEINKNCSTLNNMLELIDINKNILSKKNIEHFEKLLKSEFDNAINFYMVNYGISD